MSQQRIDPTEAAAAFGLLDNLLKNPETRPDALKLLKKLNPKLAIPELDAAKPVEDKIDALNKKFEEFVTKRADADEDAKLLASLEKVRSKRGYTDEGMEKLKKIMVDEKIANPEIAANHFDALNPAPAPAAPTGFTPSGFIDEGNKDLEPWFKDEDAAADQEIGQIFREMRNGAFN